MLAAPSGGHFGASDLGAVAAGVGFCQVPSTAVSHAGQQENTFKPCIIKLHSADWVPWPLESLFADETILNGFG